MHVELSVVRDDLEEIEIEDIEACGVVLRDLHLLEQGLAKDGDWDTVKLFEQVNEVTKHHVADLDLPVEFNQDESQGLVERRCLRMLHSRKVLQ